jgi:hypothetical protein
MKMQVLQISKKDLETMGSNSLQGMIYNKLGCNVSKEIRIEFEQTSLGWRAEHNGPEGVIIPEYVPWCLCESIVNLMNSGYKLEIGEYTVA